MPLGGVIFIIAFIAIFGTILIYLARFTGSFAAKRAHNSKAKSDIYECGIEELEKKDTKISVKFYLTAILFIMFDIEILFLYPWAVTYREFVDAGRGPYMFWVLFVIRVLLK